MSAEDLPLIIDLEDVPVTEDLVIDLLDDAREVGGVLGYGYPVVPMARTSPDLRVAAATLEGYGDYGS